MPVQQGADEIVLLRKLGEVKDATKVLLLTENSRSHERDSDTEATVDGSVASGGSYENTVSLSAYMNVSDPLIEEIEDAVIDNIAYEMWVVNKKWSSEDGKKYRSEYRQGYFTSIERTSEADGLAEFEAEFTTYQKMARGYATLPTSVENAKDKYGFHDTLESDPANDGLANGMNEQSAPDTTKSVKK